MTQHSTTEEKDAEIFAAKEQATREAPQMDDIRAEVFARWFVERFPGHRRDDGYFSKWVGRFATGREWWQMDTESIQCYLLVLTSSWHGTARAFDRDVLLTIGQLPED